MLSCSCDYEGDGDSWYEGWYACTAKTPETCCECNATIAIGDAASYCTMHEVYEPTETLPPHPEEREDWEDLPDDECWRLECEWEDIATKLGWDSEREQYVETRDEYRCERCTDLATALSGSERQGGLGFCDTYPGGLIEMHLEYVSDYVGGHPMTWSEDRDGVRQPRRLKQWEIDRDKREQWRNHMRYLLLYGWKASAYRLETMAMVTLGYTYRYDHETKRNRWMRPEQHTGMRS